MRIHILQHTKETSAGTTLDWLRSRRLDSTLTRFDRNEPLPNPADIDWLIVCGGGMGVHDEDKYPWLKREKRFIRDVLDYGSAALGLCLGGQLIAEALGAKVQKHKHWEVGWHPLRLSDRSSLTVFQWHQDSFEIPKGAERIASSDVCENQGYAFGDHVVGVQFHPEATPRWIEECANEADYPTGPHVQTPSEILSDIDTKLTPQRQWFFQMLERMAVGAESVYRKRLNSES